MSGDTNTLTTRCIVQLVTETTKCRELQVTRDGEPMDEVEHFEPFGFTSRPLQGAEALVVEIDGNTDHPVCGVVNDRRSRPTDLAEGEVAIWNPAGAELRLRASGAVDVTGNVNASANIDATSYSVGTTAGDNGTFTDGDSGFVIKVTNGIVVTMGIPIP